MRNSFITTLTAQAAQDERIFLLCGDLGYSVLEPFAAQFPERFLNVGIAEQNMMGLATGLSMEGYTVFCYSIGNFPTLRCMEQIRYDVAYHEANVKVIAVGGGYAYGPLSTSHHTTEELGMLRTIPGMVVAAPGDPAEVEAMTAFLARHRGPCYMRLNKAGEARLHLQPPPLTLGGIVPVRVAAGGAHSAAVFATGDMVGYASRYLEQHRVAADLYSFPFVNPIDTAQLAALARRYHQVATLEEHQANGGFGSAVLERLHDLLSDGALARLPAVKRIAIPNTFTSVAGTQDYLREKMRLRLDGWPPAPS
ncbi:MULTISPECIES: transketolase family protein [unclassified Janthinobacterium]|uniref:transketolase family protein n=1 Tax=unclassified Janthinobacterium TaxID=2610881 RepID=UPI00034A021B|nr:MULTISPECIES: transketolase C-terminal domain-containing protein [unclassified Janthinobacterium]MEC5163427.1 transketolase [Janthinobacterium sp. CG_S6]